MALFKITFDNNPHQNGTSTAYPTSVESLMQGVQDQVLAALGREEPTLITVEIQPGALKLPRR